MHRLLIILMVLTAALWPTRRLQDSPDTATANGPQALQAVELPRQTAPAQATVDNSGPHKATVDNSGQHYHRASTPDRSGKPPRGMHSTRDPPDPGRFRQITSPTDLVLSGRV